MELAGSADEHANISTLVERMESALVAEDYGAVLHASASIFETLAKEVVGLPTVANQSLGGFFDRYRSYVINYNLGLDLVRHYVEAEAGDDPARRWQVFAQLLSSPRLPSGLR